MPHVRHTAMAVIRPSADPGPQRFQGPPWNGGWTVRKEPSRNSATARSCGGVLCGRKVRRSCVALREKSAADGLECPI
jgi:hypothetical protein